MVFSPVTFVGAASGRQEAVGRSGSRYQSEIFCYLLQQEEKKTSVSAWNPVPITIIWIMIFLFNYILW